MKTFIQRVGEALSYSGSIASGDSITSGSIPCKGYSRITGILTSSASSLSGSGLRISQSADLGANFDYVTSWNISACSGSAFSVEIVGNAVQVDFAVDDDADEVRTLWHLRPV